MLQANKSKRVGNSTTWRQVQKLISNQILEANSQGNYRHCCDCHYTLQLP